MCDYYKQLDKEEKEERAAHGGYTISELYDDYYRQQEPDLYVPPKLAFLYGMQPENRVDFLKRFNDDEIELIMKFGIYYAYADDSDDSDDSEESYEFDETSDPSE